MAIPVVRCKRRKIMGDPASPEWNYLKPAPGHARIQNIEDIAREIEVMGGMSAEDVTHVMKSFVRSMKNVLVRGDKVKIDDMGIFYTTFNCEGTEDEKDCTVRNIKKVNIRFAVDNTLRLANDSTATTRGGANNVEFYIKNDTADTGNNGGNENPGGDNGGGYIDPDA